MKLSTEEYEVLRNIVDAGMIGCTAKQRATYLEHSELIARSILRDPLAGRAVVDALTLILVGVRGEQLMEDAEAHLKAG